MNHEQPKRRAPAFQFYADDFLAGTLDLSQSDVGAYIRLLCHQWNRGSIPVEPEKQQRLAGGSVSADVLAKFRLEPDGRLCNERLERERLKQVAFRDKQAEKGRASAEKRRNVNHGSTTVGTTVGTTVQPDTQPKGKPEGNSPSPSPSPIIPPIAPQGGESQPALTLEADTQPAPKPDPLAGFDLFWAAYPKKVSQPTAKRAWLKLKPDDDLARKIVENVQARRNTFDWTKDTGQFIPNPGTFLNQRKWEDTIEALEPAAKPEPRTAAEHEANLGRPLTWAERQALEAGLSIA